MMRVIGACSLVAGTPVVSVLGHKWSQLIGPRYPRLAAFVRYCGPERPEELRTTISDLLAHQLRQIGRHPHVQAVCVGSRPVRQVNEPTVGQ
jgi:hypothetical protein